MRIVKRQFYCRIVFLCSLLLGAVPIQSLAGNSSVREDSKSNKSCEVLPEIVKNMPIGNATFSLISGERIAFQYRLANTNERMQHGFQRTCAETIETTQMLFRFSSVSKPAFHMNNVVAPLDIAFIGKNGKIVDIYLMKIYRLLDLSKSIYSPSVPVLYALEARAGYFAELGIKVGDNIEIKH